MQPHETISMSDARQGRKLKEGICDSVAEGGASLCARNIWPGTADLWPIQPSNAARIWVAVKELKLSYHNGYI